MPAMMTPMPVATSRARMDQVTAFMAVADAVAATALAAKAPVRELTMTVAMRLFKLAIDCEAVSVMTARVTPVMAVKI